MIRTGTNPISGRLKRVLALALGLALLVPLQPGGAQTLSDRLDEARKRLQRINGELKDIRARRDAVFAELQGITAQISEVTTQIEFLRETKAATEQEIRQRKKRVGRLQDKLNTRARDAYINGQAGMVEFMLEAQSISDLTDRIAFLDALSQNDADTAAGLDTSRAELERYRGTLRDILAKEKKILADAEEAQAAQQAALADVQALEAQIEDKKGEAAEEVADLNRKYQQRLLSSLSSGSGPPLRADGPFYWCPVDSPRSYVDDFGAPRVGHTHQGNDIFAPSGTPIRAPFRGVAREGSDGLGGIVVHVYSSANADYVYNAHLSRHAGVNGRQVAPGDLIGYVGDTGNAQGTSPHDHFEYHPGGGSAVSPYAYLNEVCGVGGRG